LDEAAAFSRVAHTVDRVDELRADATGLLQQLVRFPSITGNEKDIGKFVADYCRNLRLRVEVIEAEVDRPNVVATWDSGRPGPTLLLNDHLDVVPPGPLEYWTHPPFEAVVAGGRVYGRGTIDTKSGLTTLLMATRIVREAHLPLRGKLILMLTCDEENGGRLGMQHLAKIGALRADLAVVAEPTSMRIEIATKGRLGIEIVTRGVATHGARPWLGHNAIEDMAEIVLRLGRLAEELKSPTHPFMGYPTLNIGRIDGGTVPNMVPNKCRIEVDRRLLPGEERDKVLGEFQELLRQLKCDLPRLDASLEVRVWWPGYLLDEQEPIIGIASRAFEKVVGTPPRIGFKDAATDASWINILGKIPVVMFSPGDGFCAMNADESVSVDDMIVATKVITQIICDVLGDWQASLQR
jgi:acetylornithine deacetylase/succinyl-diaminopimelate desuccinylase family protein